jgi:fatty acid desaturase
VSAEDMRQDQIDWYRIPVDQPKLAALTKRSDLQGFTHALGHLLLLVTTGSIVYWAYLGHQYLMAALVLLVHGSCYSFLGWAGAGHELVHRTVFKTRFYNDFFLFLFAFLTWNNYVYFRASHIRHHKATLFDERDGEVRLPQTFRYSDWIWSLTFNLPACWRAVRIVVENSAGLIKGKWGAMLFPLADGMARRRVVNCARIVLFGHIALAASFVISGHWPLLFVVTFAPFIADWLNKFLALAQHSGMHANVVDFRLNSRTVLLHPFLAFLYWQMNYHVEHHMYPGVPFFNMKLLRKQLHNELPPAIVGMLSLWRALVAIKVQQESGVQINYVGHLQKEMP